MRKKDSICSSDRPLVSGTQQPVNSRLAKQMAAKKKKGTWRPKAFWGHGGNGHPGAPSIVLPQHAPRGSRTCLPACPQASLGSTLPPRGRHRGSSRSSRPAPGPRGLGQPPCGAGPLGLPPPWPGPGAWTSGLSLSSDPHLPPSLPLAGTTPHMPSCRAPSSSVTLCESCACSGCPQPCPDPQPPPGQVLPSCPGRGLNRERERGEAWGRRAQSWMCTVQQRSTLRDPKCAWTSVAHWAWSPWPGRTSVALGGRAREARAQPPRTHHHQQEGLGEGEGGEPADQHAEPRGHAAGFQGQDLGHEEPGDGPPAHGVACRQRGRGVSNASTEPPRPLPGHPARPGQRGPARALHIPAPKPETAPL